MPVGYLSTPIGWLKLTATQRLLTGVALADRPEEETENPVILLAKRQLTEYFSGARRQFDIPMRYPHATPFQIKVWDALQTVGYGSTVTYGRLAQMAGCPGAARAVGGAVGRNPLLILVPCHRVLAADSIGGFTGGLEVKRALLRLEQAAPPV